MKKVLDIDIISYYIDIIVIIVDNFMKKVLDIVITIDNFMKKVLDIDKISYYY